MSDLERLANESFDRLCKKYPESSNYPSRGIMQASFEIFRNEIVFLEYCEECERIIKMNIRNGMRLLDYG
jgi:hypothetical protein